jgi:hypothetical protein
MKNNPRTYAERRDNIGHSDVVASFRSRSKLPTYADEKPRKKQPRPDRYKNHR